MFRISRPYLRFIEEPITDEGGGTDTATAEDDYSDIDFSQFGATDTATTDPTSTEIPSADAPAETKSPDVWAPVLEALPDDATREMIRPHLAEWERNTTQRFQHIREQYRPWQELADQGITPEDLRVRYELTRQIDANPVAFYERLKGALIQGGLLQEAQQVQDAIDDANGQQGQEQEVDPVAELQRQQQEFFQRIEQERRQEQERILDQQAHEATEQELQAIRDKYRISPYLERELLQRAAWLNQQSNSYVPLERAWADVQEFIRVTRQASPGNRAPRVLPPGGGLPVPERKPNNQLSDNERLARAEEVVRRMQQGG